MGPVAAVRSVLRQYATFTGRARRSEYWWFALAFAVPYGVLYVIGAALSAQEAYVGSILAFGLALVLALGLLVPSLAVGVRRLHDTGRSGWWVLLSLVPVVSLVLVVWACFDSQPGTNAHGPSPKDGVGAGSGGDRARAPRAPVG